MIRNEYLPQKKQHNNLHCSVLYVYIFDEQFKNQKENHKNASHVHARLFFKAVLLCCFSFLASINAYQSQWQAAPFNHVGTCKQSSETYL